MSRESIIQSIRTNKPSLLSIPEIDQTAFDEDVDLKDTFISSVKRVGGQFVETSEKDIDVEIKKLYPHAEQIVSNSRKSSLGNVPIGPDTNPHDLNHIDLAIIEGLFGVAENGAVWITEQQSIVRVLPFITNNLIIVLPKDQLYLHMLQAYDAISDRDRRFGLFISGPSKTADIEQSLVIGAQGAMSLTVFLI